MAVPKFRSFMLPILKLFSDIHTTSECKDASISYFKLDENDIKLTVPSSKQTLVSNRVNWSLTYLKKSLLIRTIKIGEYKITSRGKALLKTKSKQIDKKLLSQYKEYCLFSNIDFDSSISINNEKNDDITPEESIDKIYKKINEKLADDLLEIILDKDPYYFERLVMDILSKMGYGDSTNNSNIVTKKSGDEGIDRIINQDKLGLDKIYVQAKRWKEGIGRPELQKFIGALSSKKSNKGIFITTSDFYLVPESTSRTYHIQ